MGPGQGPRAGQAGWQPAPECPTCHACSFPAPQTQQCAGGCGATHPAEPTRVAAAMSGRHAWLGRTHTSWLLPVVAWPSISASPTSKGCTTNRKMTAWYLPHTQPGLSPPAGGSGRVRTGSLLLLLLLLLLLAVCAPQAQHLDRTRRLLTNRAPRTMASPHPEPNAASAVGTGPASAVHGGTAASPQCSCSRGWGAHSCEMLALKHEAAQHLPLEAQRIHHICQQPLAADAHLKARMMELHRHRPSAEPAEICQQHTPGPPPERDPDLVHIHLQGSACSGGRSQACSPECKCRQLCGLLELTCWSLGHVETQGGGRCCCCADHSCSL